MSRGRFGSFPCGSRCCKLLVDRWLLNTLSDLMLHLFGFARILAAAFSALLAMSIAATSVAQPYRTIDGTGNNAANTDWGSADSQLLRIAPSDYPDGTGDLIITTPTRPNARAISNALSAQGSVTNSAANLASGTWQWGQFLDHDIDISFGSISEPHMILAPANDPYGMAMIPMHRSESVACSGCAREQLNGITSYIDASNVYGSDSIRAAALRTGQGGRMRTSAGNLLPTSDMAGLENLFVDDGGNPEVMYVAGDARANEQLGLTAMHTLFVREHNRIADALAALPAYDSVADDETIYQKARAIVGAEMQAITYNEFLPMLLGDYAPQAADYDYNPNVNAGIANEFSTAMFRVGHTMLNENLLLATEQGNVIGQIPLREAFFTGANELASSPEYVDKLLMGLAAQTAQEIDTLIVDDVRNFLFAPQGGVGFDLAALNIERGRDHGLADYNTLRDAYAAVAATLPGLANIELGAANTFGDLDVDPATIAILESLYDSVDNIDPWVGALAENHVEGTSVGPLVLAALVDQFTRLRDGDSFFYMGDDYLWSDEVSAIVDFDELKLMDIVAWNTGMKNSPMNFFEAQPVPEPSAWFACVCLLGCGLAAGRQR